MQLVTNELDAENIRYETFKGNDYLVAPTVPIRAMNLDKGYVPTSHVEKSAPAWNGTPLTLNHPRNEHGELVSANSPDVAEKTWLGHLFNNRAVNGGEKTMGEAWFDIEHCKNLGEQAANIIDKLESGENISVSTSYFFDRLPSGEYDGELRDEVAGNIRPDHLAILLNKSGRCSIEDGCMVGAANDEGELAVAALPDDPDESDEDPMGEDNSDSTVQDDDPQSENEDDGIIAAIRSLAEKAGIVGSGDTRGYVVFEEQTSDGETVTVAQASFRDARWMTVIHVREDDEISEPIGSGEPQDAGEIVSDEEIELDEPLEDDATVVAMLHHVTEDGDMSDAITARDGERFMNSAFVGVAPDDADVGEQSINEPAESGVDETSDNMEDKTEELVNEHGFNADNLPGEDTECFDRIYEAFNEGEDDEEPESSTNSEVDEQNEETAANEELEELRAEVEELKAANEEKERQQREELIDDIVANSDRDRDTLEAIEDTTALEVIHEETAANEQAAANFAATPGASAQSSSTDASSMPSLSANERMSEKENGD